MHASSCKTVLLATVRIPVLDYDHQPVFLRALLDSGSQSTIITEFAARLLRLRPSFCNRTITGVSSDEAHPVKGCIELSIQGPENESNFSITALVMSKLLSNLPSEKVSLPPISKQLLGTRQLADPTFGKPGAIDVLIGADCYYQFVTGETRQGGEPGITFLQTLYGWAISGPIGTNSYNYTVRVNTLSAGSESILEKFWTLEEIPTPSPTVRLFKNEEEKFAEEFFLKTYTENKDGRIVTCLPFLPGSIKLGYSAASSKTRFFNQESKLEGLPVVQQQYRDFMKEFLDLGHMERVPDNEIEMPPNDCYYIPHHCVHKEESTTTKLRVVFDASAKTSSGVSLNEILAAGPTLQEDLFHILVRFRCHAIALSGDITKMYRQICLSDKDKDYHRLFWRDCKDDILTIYRMTRITYGIKSASHGSIKALQMIVEKYGSKLVIDVCLRDMYVDDLLTGFETIDETIAARKAISDTLAKGGMEIRKFSSNIPEIINDLPEKLRENIEAFEFASQDHQIKTLGMAWKPMCDTFGYQVAHLDKKPESKKDTKRLARRPSQRAEKIGEKAIIRPENCLTEVSSEMTKRRILSDIAKIFDPLGLLVPCTVILKICMQAIWLSGLDWDQILPEDLVTPYIMWRDSLMLLREINIPRRAMPLSANHPFQLHVFCDASERAYGACVYIRQVDTQSSMIDTCHVNLLTAKSKVAPVKSQSIPRLELCAAVVGMRLLKAVLFALKSFSVTPEIFAWSDSRVVLSWLDSLPGNWQTFVCNRVSEIQDVIPRTSWFHIPTKDNPADLASRGIEVEELKTSKLWWHGPEFLNELEPCFPPQPDDTEASTLEEWKNKVAENQVLKTTFHTGVTTREATAKTVELQTVTIFNFMDLSKFSRLGRATGTLSCVLRAISVFKGKPLSLPQHITVTERKLALKLLTQATQQEFFPTEIKILMNDEQIKRTSKLVKLYPFFDKEDNVLKVGGRLAAAIETLEEEKIFPAILPKKCRLSELLALYTHETLMHGGLQLCIAELRQSFWVISSRELFRKVIGNCVRCFRWNSRPKYPLMGDLPRERIEPSAPFTFTGLDFAGPFLTKGVKKGTEEKTYVAIFVCFSTKAVHIEVVSSLTSAACIAALRRFSARRGAPQKLFSDNGTNFIGARKDLLVLQQLLNEKFGDIANHVAKTGTEWVMIPPGSPNFGGLWEAAVKSAKTHMKKVVGKSILSFEELCTLMCDIESILNSRPLIQASDDPKDLTALTPNMLLTGKQSRHMPLTHHVSPEPDIYKCIHPYKRWAYIQTLITNFWKRWSKEYLSTLQPRTKWVKEIPNLRVEDMVLLTDENLPPLHWPLARIIEVFPGNDGIVRAVTVRTAKGEYKRPASKVRRLPIDTDPPLSSVGSTIAHRVIPDAA